MKKTLKLGFDFDNVIADGHTAKLAIAEKLLKKSVENNRKFGYYDNILLQQSIYYNREAHRSIPPVEDAIETLLLLQNEGHDITVVTGRGGTAIDYAKEWLHSHGVDLRLIGTYNEPKSPYCTGMELFVDDNTSFLLPMRGVVKRPYLFTRPYNTGICPDGIQRIDSWKEIYKEVHR